MNKRLKGKNGITLVALVITIIILLILAAISIQALTNQGIFAQAQNAKNLTEEKTSEESAKLYEYEQWLTNYESGKIFTNVDPSKTNPEAAMPKGATLIEGDATKGIVIKDSSNNEWVWVEVPKTVFKTATKADEYDKIKADLIKYASIYREGKAGQGRYWTDEWYDGCGIADSSTYTETYNKMLSSVYTNGGFWISRYEIGDSTATASNTTRTSSSGTTGIAVSKADQIPYNYVTCSQAQTLASGMSTDTNKTSSLLFGIQWDLVCKYLEVKEKWDTTTNTASYYLNTNSASWGNYKDSSLTLNRGKYLVEGSDSNTWTAYNVDTANYVTTSQTSNNESYYQLLTTGASEQTKKMNIYDFAGNEWEWTLEHATSDTSTPCALRGGSYYYNGSHDPASVRSSNYITDSSSDFGFRSALY